MQAVQPLCVEKVAHLRKVCHRHGRALWEASGRWEGELCQQARLRLREFFDFDYQVECFVPAPKRKYGY
ncbi:MAG: hypothetical protein EOO29_46070, partial [Comamonadaceae bacterium]